MLTFNDSTVVTFSTGKNTIGLLQLVNFSIRKNIWVKKFGHLLFHRKKEEKKDKTSKAKHDNIDKKHSTEESAKTAKETKQQNKKESKKEGKKEDGKDRKSSSIGESHQGDSSKSMSQVLCLFNKYLYLSPPRMR